MILDHSKTPIFTKTYFLRASLFILAYLVSAYVSLQLVAPPGFASLVWLPAGLALGMVLIWGMRYLPILVVASFILNIYMTYVHIETQSILHLKIWLLDAILVIGPLLQVLVAWLLIRAFMEIGNIFRTPLNIILFAIIAGPAASLVNATYSTACLYLFHVISDQVVFINWFAHWVGESIGVLIVAPMMIMFCKSKQQDKKQVYMFFLLPLMLLYLAIVCVFLLVNHYEFKRVNNMFAVLGDNKANSLSLSYSQVLHQAQDYGEYISTHKKNIRLEVHPFLTRLLFHHQNISSMGAVNDEDMQQLMKKITQLMSKPSEKIPLKEIMPAMSVNVYNKHREDLQINHSSLKSIRFMYMDSLQEGVSQLFFIRCDKHENADIGLMIVPIVEGKHVISYVFALIDFTDDIGKIFSDLKPFQFIQIGFKNSNYQNTQQALFTYTAHESGLAHNKFKMSYQNNIVVGNEQLFLLELKASEWYLNYHYSWLVWTMIIGGLFFCILMEILLIIVNGQKEIIQEKVETQTALLEKEEKTNLLLLQSADEGILGVTEGGIITFANPAVCQILGYSQDYLENSQISQLNILIKSDPGGEDTYSNGNYLLNKELEDRRQECQIQKDNGEWVWVEAIHSQIANTEQNGFVVLLSDISEQKEATEQLRILAHYDVLTGLPNRTSFFAYLKKSVYRAERLQENLAVCFLDMDNFKHINDHLGHQLGDKVLKMIPEILKPYQRQSDYLARLSGDEFGLIMHDMSSPEMVKTIVTRYLNAFNRPLLIDGNELKVTFSMGIALYPTAGMTAEDLLKNADMAMYKAKERGKNAFAFFNKETSEELERYHKINDAFANAIVNEQFYLKYQPQINTFTKEIFGVEALLRWKHPELGDVEPAEFIIIAENTGFIKEIGAWLFKQIVKDYKQLLSINADLKISINVSIKQLEEKDFEVNVHEFIDDNQTKPQTIMIEVTETALMYNFKKISALMKRLSQLGVGFALDDFGIEYSSLNYLKNLVINCIKIDKNFVNDMIKNNVSAAIVQAIIKLAHALQISAIAEGVETNEQYEYLLENGCDYIQGFYFSQPLTLEELIEKYKQK